MTAGQPSRITALTLKHTNIQNDTNTKITTNKLGTNKDQCTRDRMSIDFNDEGVKINTISRETIFHSVTTRSEKKKYDRDVQ